MLLATFATARGADLSVRLDARQIARKHVHTDLTLAVKGGGPLTLVYPKWIPGEHGPSGPLNTLIGLSIRANGQPLTWQRDPKEMFAIKRQGARGRHAPGDRPRQRAAGGQR